MDANPLHRLIDRSIPLTADVLNAAHGYVRQHAATLAWHRLYGWPVLRQRGAITAWLDGFER
jgi:hypothetical protein